MISAVKAFRVWGLVACEHENCCCERQQSSRVLSIPVTSTKGSRKCGTGCAPCPALPAPSQHLLGPKRLPEHLAAPLCSLLLLLDLVFTLRVSLPICGLKKNNQSPPNPNNLEEFVIKSSSFERPSWVQWCLSSASAPSRSRDVIISLLALLSSSCALDSKKLEIVQWRVTKMVRGWKTWQSKKGWRNWGFPAWGREGSRGI